MGTLEQTKHQRPRLPRVEFWMGDIPVRLTEKELEIVKIMANGGSTHEIAETLRLKIPAAQMAKNRMIEVIRKQTSLDIKDPVALACRVAYAAGIVKL